MADDLASNEPADRDDAPPRRGSAANRQPRDGRGRFRGRRRSRGNGGYRGPSRLALLSHLQLVRRLVVLEHRTGRLEAEAAGKTWSDPVAPPVGRMVGIRRGQAAATAENVAALKQVLLTLAERREEPHYLELRDLVREELARRAKRRAAAAGLPEPPPPKRLFSWSTLYREPYRSMWYAAAERRAADAADAAPMAKERARRSMARLRRLIRTAEVKLAGLLAGRREALVAESRVEEGWTPIRTDAWRSRRRKRAARQSQPA